MVQKCEDVHIINPQSWPLRRQDMATCTEYPFWGHACCRDTKELSTWVFHQASGSASALTAGRDKYSFTSESSFSWSDGIAFACPEANYLFFFTLIICCNNPDILFSFLLVVVVEKMLCVVAAGGFSGCDASVITACLDCVSKVSLEPGIHKTVCYSSKAVCYICSEYFSFPLYISTALKAE